MFLVRKANEPTTKNKNVKRVSFSFTFSVVSQRGLLINYMHVVYDIDEDVLLSIGISFGTRQQWNQPCAPNPWTFFSLNNTKKTLWQKERFESLFNWLTGYCGWILKSETNACQLERQSSIVRFPSISLFSSNTAAWVHGSGHCNPIECNKDWLCGRDYVVRCYFSGRLFSMFLDFILNLRIRAIELFIYTCKKSKFFNSHKKKNIQTTKFVIFN